MAKVKRQGFTLAELLVALGVLGVIATFSIPKVLTSTTIAKNRAISKETLALFSEAFQTYKLNAPVPTTMSAQDLVPYINFVKRDDNLHYQMTYGTEICNDGSKSCYIMPNGSILALWTCEFGGTSNYHAIFVGVDPDGTGPELAMEYALYYNGRILDSANLLDPTLTNWGVGGPAPGSLPDWFSYN